MKIKELPSYLTFFCFGIISLATMLLGLAEIYLAYTF